MEQLPDDIVLEILVRVTDILDLLRCAATSTRWRLLIANDSFLRRRWPEGARRRSSLLGFFSWKSSPEGAIVVRISPMPFASAPWSPFRHRCSFPDSPGYWAVPYASRRGLVLMCGPWVEGPLDLSVCDPLAGKSCKLAPLKADGRLFRVMGCTILTRADCCSNQRRWPAVPSVPTFFKVLVLSYADEQYNLHVFTSGDSSWSGPIKFFDPLEHGEITESMDADAVVCEGTAHWLYKDRSSHYTLSVSTDKTAHISLTKLPIAPDQPGFNFYSAPLLSVTDEGELSLLRLYRKCTGLEIWTRQAGGNENGDGMCWNLTNLIRIKPPERSKMDMVQCMCVGEMSGVLLIKDSKNCMYIADIEAGIMENITDLFPSVVSGAIPFEMDWPAFFMSRLAGGTIKRTT